MGVLSDVFNADGFNAVELTAAIEKLPDRPGRIGRMGLFETVGGVAKTAVIEEKDGILALLPTVARGGPGTQAGAIARNIRSFAVPHIPYEGSIKADDLIGVRAFGGEAGDLEQIQMTVNEHLEKYKWNHEVTWEHMMAGAISGSLKDSDGTTEIFNYFTEFNVTQTVVDFLLGTSTTNIRAKCMEAVRAVEDGLGMVPFGGIHCLCSDTFFDALVDHAEVKAAYSSYQAAADRLGGDVRSGFTFSGITFENYSATVGAVDFITEGDGRVFPVGAPGMFQRYNAPGTILEAVGTRGKDIYAKQEVTKYEKGIDIWTESNPLFIPTRLAPLVRVHSSN